MSKTERRIFGRLNIEVEGALKMEDAPSVLCRTRDLSYCGALLKTDVCGRIGARVILTLPQTGDLQCIVVRVLRDGFAVDFDRNLSATEMLQMLGEHCGALTKAQTSQARESGI